MSMFNELIPEVKELLEADKEQYPFLYKRIVADLQNAQLSTDVKVSTANTLIGYAEAAKVKFDSDSFVSKYIIQFQNKTITIKFHLSSLGVTNQCIGS